MPFPYDPERFESAEYLKKVKTRSAEIIREGTSRELDDLARATFDEGFPLAVRKAISEVFFSSGMAFRLTEMKTINPPAPVLTREEKIEKLKAKLLADLNAIKEGAENPFEDNVDE